MKGPAERCLTEGPSGAVLDRKGPAERCLTGRALFSGASHGGALFSGACLGGALFSGASHGGALFSGASLGGALFSGASHGGPCSAMLLLPWPCSAVLLTAGPCSAVLLTAGSCSAVLLTVGPCSAVLLTGPCLAVLLTVGPCSAVLLKAGSCSAVLLTGPCSAVLLTVGPCSAVLLKAGPVQRCFSWRGPVQRCFSRRPLFSGACLVFLGNQTWPILPAQSPSDLSVAGPSCDGVLGPWVSSVTPGMGLVGPSWPARLLPDLSALLPLPSFAESLGPLRPFVDVPGDGVRLLSLVAAVSGLSRRPFAYLVLFPGGGLAVPLLLADVPALGAGGLQ
ncbi:hypothetical protein NDU88_004540 [Pleurodeles waltl]|uniref:Uncharacterized protein n=1 Tax=Pleurodeles waltl TaxID=8319 RepID=A0AAV7V1D9_PLEWA|nr:hypothetical protein NDU88_004540 [Pleurodeles waltl]